MNIETYNKICAYLRDVIKDTSWEGKVYTVGGCCRDAIMGCDINDVDLAVTEPDGGVVFALWLEQQGLTLEPPILYKRFSTSKLRLKAFPEYEIEIVQTRKEQYTDANSRNPEVCFGTLKEDCDRRDLTINSLYQDVSTGELLDLTGRGVEDIKNHRIRTPMEPEATFSDDPIRILRAIRFALRYGWEIPEDMIKAMKNNAARLKIVRRLRVSHEFEKALMGPNPEKMLQLLKEVGIIYRVLPELYHLFRIKDHSKEQKGAKQKALPTLWDITMERLAKTPAVLTERYAALFTEFYRVKLAYTYKSDKKNGGRRGRGRSAVVATALKRLHYDKDFIREVKDLLPPVPKDYKLASSSPKKKNGGKKRNSRKASV